jgi:hypothetical protein
LGEYEGLFRAMMQLGQQCRGVGSRRASAARVPLLPPRGSPGAAPRRAAQPRPLLPSAAAPEPRRGSPDEPRQLPLPPPGGAPEPGDGARRPPPALLRWLRARLGDRRLQRVAAYLRVFLIGALSALVFSAIRTHAAAKARAAPREVLYSDFVTLIDQKRVRAARLEAGTGKVYFDINLPAASAATAATPGQQQQQQQKGGKAAAAAAAAAAGQHQQQGASVLPAGAKPSLSRHFYVKVADKTDPLLVSRLLSSGVEFGVSRPGLQAQLANVLVTTLALWLSLLPLFFILRRLIDSRSGGTQRKKKANSSAPPVTFADVAGAQGAWARLPARLRG